MDFYLRHPRYPDIRALYGFDPERGYWVEVRERVVDGVQDPKTREVERDWLRDEYDALSGRYDVARPIRGLLICLSEQGFFPVDDVLETLDIIQAFGVDEVPRRLRRIGKVVTDLHEGLA